MRSIFFGFLLVSIQSIGQVGGDYTYEFLNLPVSARSTATGGNLISVEDGDFSLAYLNPSILSKEMDRNLSVSYMNYFGGINLGNISYARQLGKLGTYHAGMQFITYGQFERTDPTGAIIGSFSASEYAMFIGGAVPVEKYSFGANVKLIYSGFADYNSIGGALDLAANWTDTAKMITASLVLKNIGFQFKPYTKGNRENLPFDLQFGFSKRLKKLPFRIHVIIHDLYRWDISYYDSSQTGGDNLFGVEDAKEPGFADKLFRHIIIGGEFFFGKAVRVGFGYDHQRRQELKLSTKTGLAGYSFGLGINIKQFEINYSLGKYHSAFSAHHLTLNTDLGAFIRPKKR